MGLLDRFKGKNAEDEDEDEEENFAESEDDDGDGDGDDDAADDAAEDEFDGEDEDEGKDDSEDGDEEEEEEESPEFDDDDEYEDDDEEEDDEDGESKGGKIRAAALALLERLAPPGPLRLITAGAGIFIVFSLLAASVVTVFSIFSPFSGGEDAPQAASQAARQDRPGTVSLALPSADGGLTPSGGGLNAFGAGAGSETAAAGMTAAGGLNAAADAGMDAGMDGGMDAGIDGAQDSASALPAPAEEDIEMDGLNAFAVQGGPTQRSGTDIVVNVTSEDAFLVVPDTNTGAGLKTELDEALLESVQGGAMVPKIDGRRSALKAYARPANPPAGQPRVAVVVVGLGHSKTASEAAIERLPPEMSLSFDVYAPNLQSWVRRSWSSGHEVLISLPMESKNFPNEDAGPLRLRTDISVTDNIKMLDRIMSRARGYIGVRTVMGSAFMADEERTRAVLDILKQRGVMILESTRDPGSLVPRLAAEMGVPRAFTNVKLDVNPSRAAVDQRLADLEAIARQRGVAVGVTHAQPSALERIAFWAQDAKDRGVTLIPISAIASRNAGKT